jgi:hypothetical protein
MPSGGFGSTPFGTGPFGFGMPVTGTPATGQLFADAQTGTIGTGRKIDQGTRQYAFDSDGNPVGQDTVPQLVQLAYSTVKGSSILPDLGESYSELETIGDDFQDRLTALATAPVQFLIDDKRLEILSVTIDRIGVSGARIAVAWRDTTTGREGQVTL